MGMQITKFAIPEIIFGRGSVQHLGSCARSLGAHKVFLVSDPGLEETGWLNMVRELLHTAGLDCVEYCEVTPNPRDFEIQRGALLYKETRADVIIALGGGSPMDAAKGIGIVASNGFCISDYEGANRIDKPLPPMIFLPTTAGSGSDLTQFCIVTDMQRKLKMSIISRSLVPNISITDPDFLATKPTILIVDSAIDSLAHAIESFVSPAASPFTEMQARCTLNLWRDNIFPATNEHSPAALEQLSLAAAAAGMSFSNAGLGAGHALAHAVGGRLDLRHGMMHAILLPSVMRFNLPHCFDKMREIMKILIPGKNFSDKLEVCEGISMMEDKFNALDVPVRLHQIVPDRDILPSVCEAAANDVCMLTNPRPATVQDLLSICHDAW